MVFSFFINAYLARVLGKSNYGYLAFSQSIVIYMSLFVDMGLSNYGIRAVAYSNSKSNYYLVLFTIVKLCMSFIMLVIASIIFLSLYNYSNINLIGTLIASTLFIIPFSINAEWYYLGNNKFGIVAFSKFIDYLILAIYIFVTVKSQEDLLHAATAKTVGAALSILWLCIFVNKLSLKSINVKHSIYYLCAAKWFMINAVLSQIFVGVDVIILQIYRQTSEVGMYAASFKLASFFSLFISLINMAMYPMLSKTYTSNRHLYVNLLFIYMLLSIVMSSFIFVISQYYVSDLLLYTYGNEYAEAGYITKVLLYSSIIMTINGAIAQPLIAAKKEKIITMQIISTSILYLIMNRLLIPQMGAVAAAYVYLFSVLIGTLMLIPCYIKEIKLCLK